VVEFESDVEEEEKERSSLYEIMVSWLALTPFGDVWM